MSELVDRLRDTSTGRAALDRWSRFKYLPQATKIRYGAYAGLFAVVAIVGIWQLSSRGGVDAVAEATQKHADEIRQQAAVPPPPAVATNPEPEYKGPAPRSVKGGGPPPE